VIELKVKREKITLFITEDGSHSLQVPAMGETYHSSHGAIQESNHVFIKNGLEYWLRQHKKTELRIFEVGFGTGLNALLTLLKAEELDVSTHYQTVELFPLEVQLTNQLNYTEQLHCNPPYFKALHTAEWGEPVAITSNFSLTKINAAFADVATENKVDLIYYDAFAPSKQPEMWVYKLIEKCYAMLNKNGVFVTYSAKGQLKRDLKQAGFSVESLPGPPGKFEMVRATKDC